MAASNYSDPITVSSYIGLMPTANDVTLLSTMITACSRAFDRETSRPSGFWGAQTAVTRRYSGSGIEWLDLDDWDAITAATVSTKQDRSDATALSLPIAGVPQAPDYVEIYPFTGPPFDQLFLLKTWYPDTYGVGNVAVTGNTVLQPEIADAVAIWVAYRWKRMRADWADRVSISSGPSLEWKSARPDEVQRVIDHYKAEATTMFVPLHPRTQSPRLSPLGADARLSLPDLLGNS